MPKYRLFLAGPTSTLELRVVGDYLGEPLNVEEDGLCWVGNDIVFAPDRFIAMIHEDYFIGGRDVSERDTSSADPGEAKRPNDGGDSRGERHSP